MASVPYSTQMSKTEPHPFMDSSSTQVFHFAELADFVVSTIVYGALLAYLLRSIRRVMLYFLLSGAPRVTAQLLDAQEIYVNKTGHFGRFGRSHHTYTYSIHDLRPWAFFITTAIIFSLGLRKRSSFLATSVISIATFPTIYIQIPANLKSITTHPTIRTTALSTAATITRFSLWAICLLLPALVLMARMKSPWFRPLSVAVILAIPLLLVQQDAIEGTYWYVLTNMVMGAYCTFLYAHFFLAVVHQPRMRPLFSGFLGLGVLPGVLGLKFGQGMGNTIAGSAGKAANVLSYGTLDSTIQRMPIGWWMVAGCALWILECGVLVVLVGDWFGMKITAWS